MQIFLDEVCNLHCGQSLDLHWRHHGRCPTTDEYIMMVDNKTGGLFRLMVRLMEAESPSPTTTPHLSRLLTLTGRYYQIRDDYMNLTSADVSLPIPRPFGIHKLTIQVHLEKGLLRRSR
jgi:geranylgeranyl pyrophosphate synthase